MSRKARKFIRRAEVKARTGLSYTTMWRREREGKFPKRVVLSESGAVGWFSDEIDEWVASRARGLGRRPRHIAPAKPTADAPANDLTG